MAMRGLLLVLLTLTVSGRAVAERGHVPRPKPVPPDWPSVDSAVAALFDRDIVFINEGTLSAAKKAGLRKRVAQFAKEWRRARDPGALSALYHEYITRLAEGRTPVPLLVNLLGPPDSPEEWRGRGEVHYFLGNGSGMFLEADKEQRLRGRTFD